MIKYLIFTLCVMTACSSLPSIDYIAYAQSSFNYVSGKNNYHITQEDFDNQEYSFLKVELEDLQQLRWFLHMQMTEYNRLAQIIKKLYTFKGKVIESSGFTNDIKFNILSQKLKIFLMFLR